MEIEAFLSAWIDILPQALVLLCFRALPFVFYIILNRRISFWEKSIWVCSYAVPFSILVYIGTDVRGIVSSGVVLFLFALDAMLVFWLRNLLAVGRISKKALFVFNFLLFMLLPALFVPRQFAFVVLILGWDMTLSSYSFCVDTMEKPNTKDWLDCLFFILINPTLVYRRRGKPVSEPAANRCAVFRLTWGMLCLVAYCSLAAALPMYLQLDDSIAKYNFFIKQDLAINLLGLYLTHSGVASVQIGLMRLAGYEIPERYNYPFLATTPLEFWRRWNIWIGQWATQYIFYPLGLYLMRKRYPLPQLSVKAAAAIVTFGAIGIHHDLYWYLCGLHFEELTRPNWSLMFVLFGFDVFIWLSIEELIRKSPVYLIANQRRSVGIVGRVISWIAFVKSLTVIFWLSNFFVASNTLSFPA